MSDGAAEHRLHRLLRADGDFSLVQVGTSAVIIVLSLWTVRPVGSHGTPLAVLVLLVLNCVLLASRHVPDRYLSTRTRLVLLYAGAFAAAGLVALARSGIGSAFGFFVAGHAGFRLPAAKSRWVAVTCSVLCGGVLLLGWGGGHWFTPWFVGAATGFSVVLGMLNRSRAESYQAAVRAAEAAEAAAASAERAARAEARETVLAERGRIARDVHDVLAHSLAGISMQLNLANALLDKGETGQAREVTGKAQALVRDSLVEAQRTVHALREDNLPLVETLRGMVRNGGQGSDVEIDGVERELPTTVTQALIRASQEALTNAHKYAPSAPVQVTLRYGDRSVVLELVNPPSTGARPLAVGSGMGLVGMRERLALVGGSVTAGPEPDGGWRVRLEAPG